MICLEHLTKKFGKETAVADFSIEIREGSIFGLIGSNGSGKSTVLRIIAGIYKGDGGNVTLNDIPIFEHEQAM